MITAGLILVGVISSAALIGWSLHQKKHGGLRIYGPAYFGRYLFEEFRPKLTQYLERPGDGRPFSLLTRSWVYRASKNLSTKEGFGTTRDMHLPGTHVIVPAPFGLTEREMPDDSFSHKIGRDGREFIVKYPIIRSAMSFGSLGATATRSLSDGTAILGDGALDNTGEGGLSIHHCPVSEEGERYRRALISRSKEFGRPFDFRFDKTATSDGKIVNVSLDLHRYKIHEDGTLVYCNSEGRGASEKSRNLIVQIGPSMSGFKTPAGDFDWEWLKFVLSLEFVAGVEIKLHQGAKPNDGGNVPVEKLTKEIAALRSIPLGEDYQSPERNLMIPKASLDIQMSALLSLVDDIQNLEVVKKRGLIVGLKTTFVGDNFTESIADQLSLGLGPDYIQVDGAEGGTGSADTAMTDRVGYHTYYGVEKTNDILSARGVRDKITIIASGRLADPGAGAMTLCLGADMIASARGPMLSLGCIQSRLCNTNKCPAGIATHNSWRLRGLDPQDKSVRYANYILRYRATLTKLARAAGVDFTIGQSFKKKNLWIVE